MRYSDHPLITEAWRRAEQFEQEARQEGLLAQVQAANVVSWRHRAARLLVKLAGWLEPKPNPLPNDAHPDCR